jgi:hypothetical protein
MRAGPKAEQPATSDALRISQFHWLMTDHSNAFAMASALCLNKTTLKESSSVAASWQNRRLSSFYNFPSNVDLFSSSLVGLYLPGRRIQLKMHETAFRILSPLASKSR